MVKFYTKRIASPRIQPLSGETASRWRWEVRPCILWQISCLQEVSRIELNTHVGTGFFCLFGWLGGFVILILSSNASTLNVLLRPVVGTGRKRKMIWFRSARIFSLSCGLRAWAMKAEKIAKHTGSQRGYGGGETPVSINLHRPAPALKLTPGQASRPYIGL